MELLDGASLAELVADAGPQPQGRAAYLIAQAARALGEAHHDGIVHRDVKPDNILITRAGGEPDFVKVIDFGIARSRSDADVTAVGEVAGTPSYMAPEVIAGGGASPRSDVYGIGGVLYFLVTGAPPFVAPTSDAVMYAHRHEPLVPPSLRAAGPLDAELEQVIVRCLAKDPADRFADGAAVAEALVRCAACRAWSPAPASSAPAPSAAPARRSAAGAHTEEPTAVEGGGRHGDER